MIEIMAIKSTLAGVNLLCKQKHSRAKSSFSDVIKTTILLKDIKDFQTVNEIYAQCFTDNLPARAAFQVSKDVDFRHPEI